jgi:hypothetical protein
MKSRTHFIHRIDMLDDDGEILEHLAGVEDFALAEATWQAAIKRWPKAAIMLRQGSRIVFDCRKVPKFSLVEPIGGEVFVLALNARIARLRAKSWDSYFCTPLLDRDTIFSSPTRPVVCSGRPDVSSVDQSAAVPF